MKTAFKIILCMSILMVLAALSMANINRVTLRPVDIPSLVTTSGVFTASGDANVNTIVSGAGNVAVTVSNKSSLFKLVGGDGTGFTNAVPNALYAGVATNALSLGGNLAVTYASTTMVNNVSNTLVSAIGLVTNGLETTVSANALTNTFTTTNLLTSTSNTLAGAVFVITNGLPTTAITNGLETIVNAGNLTNIFTTTNQLTSVSNTLAGMIVTVTNGLSGCDNCITNGSVSATLGGMTLTNDTFTGTNLVLLSFDDDGVVNANGGGISNVPYASMSSTGVLVVSSSTVTQGLDFAKPQTLWFPNATNNLFLVGSNYTAGGWVDVGIQPSNTVTLTLTIDMGASTTNWAIPIIGTVSNYTALSFECFTTSPSTNIGVHGSQP